MEQFVVDRLRATLGDRVTTPDRPGLRRRPDHVQRDGPAAAGRDRPGPRRRRRGRRGRRGQRPRPADRGPRRRTQRRGPRDGRRRPGRRPARSRDVSVDPATGIVRVAGGARWEDVDAAAWAHHLAVVGGTFGDTGVGGLTLGGGIGWLSGHPGLHLRQPRPRRARDRGRRAGRGRAGRRSRPALGAARRRRQLRRGHELRVPGDRSRADPGRLHPLPDPCRQAGPAPARRRSPTTAPDALELMAQIGPHDEVLDGALSVRVGVCWPGDIAVGDRASCDRCGRPCRRSRDTVGPMDYPDVQAMSGRLPFGLRHYWKGHFLRALDESMIDGDRRLDGRPTGRHQRDPARGRSAGRPGREPEGGAAFGQRAATWNASALGDLGRPGRRRRATSPGRARRPIGSAVGSLTGAGYANYAPVDEPIERVRLAFGTERFARLAAIKARYDPDNRFRFNLNIAPAVIGRGRGPTSRPGPRSRPPGGRRASRARRRRAPRAAGRAARRRRAASRSAPGGPRRARTGRSRPRAADRPASSSATVRWSSARASSKVRASIAGSVVVATMLLFVRFGQPVDARGEEHTKPDPDDRHDGHDARRRHDDRDQPAPSRPDGAVSARRRWPAARPGRPAARDASRAAHRPGRARSRPSSARRTMA